MKKIYPFALLMAIIVPTKNFSQSSTLNRTNDPVILKGANLPSFLGLSPSAIVAFRFTTGSWQQIPVQVDEMAWLDIVTPYGPYADDEGYPPPTGVNELFYSDAGTYTGADPDAGFDPDDELVFMAKDAGGQNTAVTNPAGVVSGTCQEVMISDPLGGVGFVYLFQQDGSLQPGAGISYVSYTYQLSNGGTYPVNFTFLNAINNENSLVSTANYSWHFSAEWISDELKIAKGGAPNTDILDRHKNFYANNNCVRSETTFSEGDNAFVTNKVGPIRAIRSYMGANSGPLTQRTHLFYLGRQDILTDLRVHNIASMYDAIDYASGVNGSKYYNNFNISGVVINGAKDAVTLGDISWELFSGSKGSLVLLHRRNTNITSSEATFTSYYDDNKTKAGSKCTGDGQAWGTSGVGTKFLNGSVCTDPLSNGCGIASSWFRTLRAIRIVYFESPNGTTGLASTYNNQWNNPLSVIAGSCTVTSGRMKEISTQSVAGIRIYPNPVSQTCILSFNAGNMHTTQVNLYNVAGSLVRTYSISVQPGNNLHEISMRNLVPGTYYLKLITSKQVSIQKLIVQ